MRSVPFSLVLVVVFALLAGCGSAPPSYPEDFVVHAEALPSHIHLVGPSDALWNQTRSMLGIKENPGYSTMLAVPGMKRYAAAYVSTADPDTPIYIEAIEYAEGYESLGAAMRVFCGPPNQRTDSLPPRAVLEAGRVYVHVYAFDLDKNAALGQDLDRIADLVQDQTGAARTC